jgi:hypothetical protein
LIINNIKIIVILFHKYLHLYRIILYICRNFRKRKFCKYIKKLKNKEMNRILLPHGALKKLIELAGVSEPTARMALRGQRHTTRAFKIRKLALELGGVEMSAEKERVIKL